MPLRRPSVFVLEKNRILPRTWTSYLWGDNRFGQIFFSKALIDSFCHKETTGREQRLIIPPPAWHTTCGAVFLSALVLASLAVTFISPSLFYRYQYTICCAAEFGSVPSLWPISHQSNLNFKCLLWKNPLERFSLFAATVRPRLKHPF